MDIKYSSFDTETINRLGHGEACLLIKKNPGLSPEFLEFPPNFGAIFDFLAGKKYVCWNMDFDARAIIHPEFLPWNKIIELGEKGRIKYRNYSIEYVPNKKLIVYRGEKSFILYDLKQFFEMSLDGASKKYLSAEYSKKLIPKSWYNRMDFHLKGKNRQLILEYAAFDVISLEKLLEKLINSYASIGILPPRLTSAGSISANYFKNRVPAVPDGVNRVFSKAFYGAAIEAYFLGEICGKLRMYDIHSAYPSEIAKLRAFRPVLYKTRPAEAYSIYRIKYFQASGEGYTAIRQGHGEVIFPIGEINTWVGGSQFEFLRGRGIDAEILDQWHVPIMGDIVYPEIGEMYDKRKHPVSGFAIKKILNSWYGKLCERAEGRRRQKSEFGRWASLPWACEITERTRIKIFRALELFRAAGWTPIFCATDGILVLEPENGGKCPISLGDGLGEWGLEGEYDRAVVLGCGRYFLYKDGKLSKQHLRGFPANYPPENLEHCDSRRKRIMMRNCFSMKEWANLNAMPEYNVLLNTPRYLEVSDTKRHWPALPKTVSECWSKKYESESLIAYS